MWNMAVLVVLLAVTGVYVTRNMETADAAQISLAGALAGEMSVYRTAVTEYFSAHDLYGLSVSTATLKSSGALPSWSKLFQQNTPLIWRNYRDGNGVIYIFSSSLPAFDITAEIASLSQNSMLAGFYKSGSATLQSPVFGDTNIPLTALAGMSVPNGAPVWIAMTK